MTGVIGRVSASGASAMSRMMTVAIYGLLLTLGMLATAHAQTVRITTNLGNIDVEMQPASAPNTVANFLKYVNRKAYDGTFIHRSVANFVIQGGGFRFDGTNTFTVNADPPIANEFKLSNKRGTLAMATLSGDPNSATTQWFFNLTDNSQLLDTQNGGYAVFGVIKDPASLVVMDKIAAVPVFDKGAPFDTLPLINYVSGAIAVANLVQVQTVAVVPDPVADYGITASPSTVNIVAGQTGSTTLTVTPTNGFQGVVNFSCGTLPASASCAFSPASVTFAAGSTAAQTVTLTINTKTTTSSLASLGAGGGGIAVLRGLGGESGVFGIFAMTAMALIALSLSATGRRVLAISALVTVAGCGGDSSSAPVVTPSAPVTTTTPAGTYTVPVTVSSGSTSHPLNLTVIVS